MRTALFIVAAALLAGCATAPATGTTQVYDHKSNIVRYAAKPADSAFVGTSATEPSKAPPTWYRLGHP